MRIELQSRVQPLKKAVLDLEGRDVRVEGDGDLLEGHPDALHLEQVVVAVALHQGTKAPASRQQSQKHQPSKESRFHFELDLRV